jgi:hypothetical protein
LADAVEPPHESIAPVPPSSRITTSLAMSLSRVEANQPCKKQKVRQVHRSATPPKDARLGLLTPTSIGSLLRPVHGLMNPPQSRRQSALTHPSKSTWRSRPTFIETKCARAAPKHAESSAQVLLCCNVDEFPNSGRLNRETCAHALVCLLLHTPDNEILSHVGPLHTNVAAWVLVSTWEPQRWVAEAVG